MQDNQPADAPAITEEQIEKLLGRTLTPAEEDAFEIYEQIAEARIADLLCVESIEKLLEAIQAETIPLDLQLTIARFFGAISTENQSEPGVQSKQVEDFRITYESNRDVMAETIRANSATLQKYSQCGIIHGRTLKQDPRYHHGDSFLSF